MPHISGTNGPGSQRANKLLTNPDFWEELANCAVDVKINPGKSIAKIQKSLFKVCHEIVEKRYAKADPDNTRHADLIALFMFNFWNSIGVLPMMQVMVISAQLNEDEE